MYYSVTRLTQPTFDILDADELEQWCRIDPDVDVLTLSMLLASAVAYVEGATGLTLLGGNFDVAFNAVDCAYQLPLYPVQSVVGVRYASGTDPYPAYNYEPVSGMVIVGDPCSQSAPPIVTVTAGYADATSMPDELRWAVSVLVDAGYDNRSMLDPKTLATVDALVSSQKRVSL